MASEQQIKVELEGRDEFWRRAFYVEWEHQFPDRKLAASGSDHFLASPAWLEDLARVAEETFCRVRVAPENRQRRQWLTSLIARRGR